MKSLLRILIVLILLAARPGLPVLAQSMVQAGPVAMPGETGIREGRLIGVIVGTTAFYTVTLLLLKKQWYKKSVPFHFFNDNREWLQMDKIGHSATAYAMSRGGYELFRWSGVNERASTITGGLLALLFQSTIEVYDGFSEGWGFSKGDMLANVAGTALFVGQQYSFGEQKVSIRYGWRKSIYAPFRPNLLGEKTGVQFLKDYNAQQYWLSVNLASVLPVGPDFPRWLNLAVGYSGSGMTGGHENPVMTDAGGKPINFPRYRQFFLSPDIDLARLPGLGEPAQRFIGTAQFFKIAGPSLEYNRLRGLQFHPFLHRKD